MSIFILSDRLRNLTDSALLYVNLSIKAPASKYVIKPEMKWHLGKGNIDFKYKFIKWTWELNK